ncbi:MAG TPA: ATP-binding protein [Polyangia bacterium]|jgi:hypothetical protein
MRRLRPNRLTVRLTLASLGSAAAVALVCGVALVSLRNLSALTRSAVTRQITVLNDTAAFQSLLYQKGFVAEYMLTRDPMWLAPLEASRSTFATWLARAHEGGASAAGAQLLDRIEREYEQYDGSRRQAIAAFESGRTDAAKGHLATSHNHIAALLGLVQEFGQVSRLRAEQTLAESERSTTRLAWLIVSTSLLAALASLAVGFLWARRVARPIYELELTVASAADKTRIEVRPGRDDLDALAGDVAALVRKLEETDASLIEHRRRLVQSEKLSAVGELAAKLGHEILNPLAGMKAAVQVLARTAGAGPVDAAELRETAVALDGEIARVSELVRRLVDYSRPLAPRVEVCPVERLLEQALEVAQRELARAGATVRRAEERGLPPIEVDPLLVTQALANLLTNAAQAQPGGVIALSARRAADLGREHVRFAVADEGPGLTPAQLDHLFLPFFTTKPKGHGLGLAISRNIALEHGGRLEGRNRDDRPGAVFDLWLPLVR